MDFIQKADLFFIEPSFKMLNHFSYKTIKNALTETFKTTENLIQNFENKTFVSLQRYIILITASKILRKFFFLSIIFDT